LAIEIIARVDTQAVVDPKRLDVGGVLHVVARVIAGVALKGHDHDLPKARDCCRQNACRTLFVAVHAQTCHFHRFAVCSCQNRKPAHMNALPCRLITQLRAIVPHRLRGLAALRQLREHSVTAA